MSPRADLFAAQMESVRGKAWTDAPAPARVMPPGDYPLLTFVLINWNYARFLGTSIDSIRNQNYPNFDCIVIDNDSSDDSLEVARKRVGDDRRFSIRKTDANHGQLGAALRIADEIEGKYVCIVDADDYLFANYASAHVQVREALDHEVGVSSGNVVEVDSSGAILSGHPVMLNRPVHAKHSRQVALGGDRLPVVDAATFEVLKSHSTVVEPSGLGWVGAPGTANVYLTTVFRRACALSPTEISRDYAADTHFNNLGHWLAGTALIDIPLSAYRIHGANAHSYGPKLDGTFSAPRSAIESGQRQRTATCAALIRKRAKAADLMTAKQFWRALDHFARYPEGIVKDQSVVTALAESFASLAKEFGERGLLAQLRARLPIQVVQDIVDATPDESMRRFRSKELADLEALAEQDGPA